VKFTSLLLCKDQNTLFVLPKNFVIICKTKEKDTVLMQNDIKIDPKTTADT